MNILGSVVDDVVALRRLSAAKLAVDWLLNIGGMKAGNWNPRITPVDPYVNHVQKEVRDYADKLIKEKGMKISEVPFRYAITRKRADLGAEYRAGNCREMAAVVYFYFVRLRILPVELWRYPKRAGCTNHAFLLIGRDLNANQSDPMKWNGDAVICDPWAAGKFNKAYLGAYYVRHYQLRMGSWLRGFNNPQHKPVRWLGTKWKKK